MCLSCTVTDILSVEYRRDLEILVMGRSKSVKIAPINRLCTTYYWFAIISIALSVTVFELLDIEEYHDFEIYVTGHSRSLKMEPFKSLDRVS